MRGKDEIIRTGLLKSELEEIAAGGPLEVRCPAIVPLVKLGKTARCLEIFEVSVNVDLGVYQGSCPLHGLHSFCITIQGAAGVAAFVASDDDRKALAESKKPAESAGEPAPGPALEDAGESAP